MDTHGIVEMMKEMANAKGGDDFKIIFIHNGMWFKMQMRNGCYSEERRPDTSGFSGRPEYRSLERPRRQYDMEASA
tara:strand:- start:396 stop:623 length:228 start_codon:yes stop_codon:yes gene_type:complete